MDNTNNSFYLLRLYTTLCLTLLLFPLLFKSTAFATKFSGVVVDTKEQPISNAIVHLQGTSFSTLTNQSGHFYMANDDVITSKYITAWKSGFYNGGEAVSIKNREYQIVLNPVPLEDNEEYQWLPSLQYQKPIQIHNKGEDKPCQICHPILTEQWRQGAHAHSTKNPLFLSFFNGTDVNGKNDVIPGYKLDFPNSNGNCATCHVPALALNNPFNSDPNEAQGVAREGIFCDLCHKIDSVNIDKTGGKPGILSIQFQRPIEGHQIFYGPYEDVFPGNDSYHPLYEDSRYCAPCHNGKFWDVLVYSEFQEWTESSYARKNIHCQNCHMKPNGIMTRFALEEEGGVLRDPATIPSHEFRGIKDTAFMSDAIELKTQADLEGDVLKVSVTIKNINAGHHYPTGNPMRNMILLVNVTDKNDKSLQMIKGERVPSWGGVGDPENGNYSDLPGKGFAKVLKDVLLYPDKSIRRHFQYEYPAPHWRPTVVESDNRIPADGSDISNYQFKLPKTLSKPIHITTRLIFRRAFKSWLEAKNFEISDMEITRNNIIIEP